MKEDLPSGLIPLTDELLAYLRAHIAEQAPAAAPLGAVASAATGRTMASTDIAGHDHAGP